jgi:hypothetical protein
MIFVMQLKNKTNYYAPCPAEVGLPPEGGLNCVVK